MKVKFVPQNIEVEIKPNESVLTVAQNNGIHIQSVCKGIPSCAECRVYLKDGETNVVPPLQPELELIGTAYFIDHRRLSCQLRCFGDVVVDLTEQIEKQSKSTKNPQGRYVKEKEDSKARMGNILEEEGKAEVPKELLEGLEPEDFEPLPNLPKNDSESKGMSSKPRHQGSQNQNRSRQNFQKNFKKDHSGNRNPNADNSQGQQKQTAQGQGQNPNQKPNNKNKRRFKNKKKFKNNNQQGGQAKPPSKPDGQN